MRFLKASILTLNLFYGLTPAQPSTPPSSTDGPQLIDGQRLPDGWYALNLDDSSAFPLPATLEVVSADVNTTDAILTTTTTTNSRLAVREPIRVCESTLSRLAQCATLGSFVYSITAGIAGIAFGQSKEKSCAKITGNINGWQYEYYGTGRNCDTTAQRETIHGALYHYFSSVESNKVCGTQCLSLDHGGTYRGYLKFGKAEWFDASAYCGQGLPFAACASGGNNSFK